MTTINTLVCILLALQFWTHQQDWFNIRTMKSIFKLLYRPHYILYRPHYIAYSLVFSLGLASNTLVMAASFDDPSWPCIQKKVVDLSFGLIWPEQISDETQAELDSLSISDLSPEEANLVTAITLRRIPLDDVETQLASYIKASGDVSKNDLLKIMKVSFTSMNNHRKLLINGIGSYSRAQIALAAKIDDLRQHMKDLEAAEKPDYDAMDALEEKIDWSERIYTDRAKSLIYVCESPVLLEKRLYAIAKLLAKQF